MCYTIQQLTSEQKEIYHQEVTYIEGFTVFNIKNIVQSRAQQINYNLAKYSQLFFLIIYIFPCLVLVTISTLYLFYIIMLVYCLYEVTYILFSLCHICIVNLNLSKKKKEENKGLDIFEIDRFFSGIVRPHFQI